MKPSKEAIEAALQTLPMNDILNGDTSKPVSLPEMKQALEAAYAVDTNKAARLQTQFDIQSERGKIQAEADELNYQLEILRGRQKALQKRCKHPNMKAYYSMGESEMICPDCSLII